MRNLVIGLVLLAGAACNGGEGPEPTPSPTANPVQRPASTATIRIVEPQPGAVVEGPDVPVKVELENARLIDEVTTDIKPDEGHIHLTLDGKTITLLAGLDEEIPDVAPGPHLLEVEFVAGDHGPFNPRVIQSVSFTVE